MSPRKEPAGLKSPLQGTRDNARYRLDRGEFVPSFPVQRVAVEEGPRVDPFQADGDGDVFQGGAF